MLRANLNLLPTLKVLLETRNISRAAELLHLSQPSISKQLAQLRSEFDDELLVREGQRWLLTPRAELLAAQLADSLGALERLYEAPGFDPSRCERVFRLASSDYVAQHILPDICAALAKEAPLAALEYSLWDKRQLPQLWQSELDLVSTITEQVPEQIRGLHQGEDRLAVLMGRHHPLAGKALSLDDYLAWPHLQVSGGGDKDSPVEQVLAPQGLSRHWFARVPFFQAAVEVLLRTDCLMTTPAHIAWQLSCGHELTFVDLPFAARDQQYHLLWHQRHHQDPAHRWFRELAYPFLRDHLQHTVGESRKLLDLGG
ncbi:LysR family transcriptional regulator [Aeromonas veronii]|uniref:LysR family transcriptional regulator n=1 Tax=Aeromonas veronii TaxID=654 RepID=UPI000D7591B3|nr:LysR family transcriptional regulator [Aeromonas veronii]KAE9628045.1 LysR family transcriptional regulator [Aeromonas veronii]MCF5853903.1 LysR family transcriptional regulator [Aeromonas veronii]MCO4172865.1 LysR family transcriptional regulator [Aeromonas veronii]TNI44565.1 LysR family transcriptional regulator [Aeromonas veronii]TNI59600.1 LysR family transcriptional regulator [Aeromonas veronii]